MDNAFLSRWKDYCTVGGKYQGFTVLDLGMEFRVEPGVWREKKIFLGGDFVLFDYSQ